MSIESEQDFAGLSKVGKVVGLALKKLVSVLRSGITTGELDAIGEALLNKYGARSAPQLLYGFPGSILISLNDEAVHGIPGNRVIRPGDLVKIDVTAELDGYIADAATTIAVPPVTSLRQRLASCAKSAFWRALEVARAGAPLSRIGRAIEQEARRHGFNVMPDLHGHGIGRVIHERPTVYNFENPTAPGRLTENLVITIEPIITSGSGQMRTDADGWTVRTSDGCPAAHYEHTVVVTKRRPILLTALA